jgi:purine-binding chemotaxis protein CheW
MKMEGINSKSEEFMDTLINRYLTFLIDKETYGIEIRYVMEIVGLQNITEMPEMPSYIKGIINLRSRIIPVMDVRIRFGKSEKSYNDRTCVIVITYRDMLYGLIVDNVSEVLTIQAEDISEVPSVQKDNGNRFIKNIGKIDSKVALLLECEKLLYEIDLSGVGSINQNMK